MNIKLILLDLDDTLLNSQGKLSKRLIKTINEVKQKGIIVAIASGRMYVSLLPYVNKLKTHGPVVSYNGALIKDSETDKILFSKPIPLDVAKEVLQYVMQNNVFCQYYTNEDYFFEEHCEISEDYCKSTDIKGIAVGENLHTKISVAPPKLLVIESANNNDDLLMKLKSRFGDILEITRSKARYIEIMSKNVNKGIALLKMCEILNIPIENTIAFGDGLNDLEMIEDAQIGVAVKSGNENLKKAADYICDTPDNDGPTKFIEKYIINN